MKPILILAMTAIVGLPAVISTAASVQAPGAQLSPAARLRVEQNRAAIEATARAAKTTTRQAALAKHDWRTAAFLGATAADIVRLEQAQGRLSGLDPAATVVTLGIDGAIESALPLKPLPPMPGGGKPDMMVGDFAPSPYVSGPRTPEFTGLNKGKIILRPPYFASDYGAGAPTPKMAAQWVGITL